ncbi:hypothetical protein SD80_015695 [Scytonema tolypothrichoides VB-61278]|nr:hypothetical protein SD80_015695 [Scytonema tolypothrichoides VB-61278]
MNSIIRSNAVETLSKTDNTGINFHKFYPYCDLVSQTAFIYENHLTSIKQALPQAPIETRTATLTKPQIASKNTGYWSTFLQTLLDQLPLTVAHLVTLKNITFFTTVVVWAWTGKIQQISHVREKFVALDSSQKLQLQDLSKVLNTGVKEAQEFKTGQVVAESDREPLLSKVDVQKQEIAADDQTHFNHIKDLMARTRILAQTRALAKAQQDKAGLEASDKLEPQNAEMPVQPTERLKQRQIQQLVMKMTHLQNKKVQINLDALRKVDFSTRSKNATSILSTAKPPATAQ